MLPPPVLHDSFNRLQVTLNHKIDLRMNGIKVTGMTQKGNIRIGEILNLNLNV